MAPLLAMAIGLAGGLGRPGGTGCAGVAAQGVAADRGGRADGGRVDRGGAGVGVAGVARVPESPEEAVLESKAVALASPVSPVLVVLLWEVAAPELPLVAIGLTVRLAAAAVAAGGVGGGDAAATA